MTLSKQQKILISIFILIVIVSLILYFYIPKCEPDPDPPDPDPPNTCGWVSSDWTECDPTTQTQTRTISCVKSDRSDCDKCIESIKPSMTQPCTSLEYCCDKTIDGSGCTPNNLRGCGSSTPVHNCNNCTNTGWPSNVYFFSPEDDDIQSKIYDVFSRQGGYQPENNGQFSLYNYALLFTKGTYTDIDIPIGYYTHVSGLGHKISDVIINGKGPHVDNSSMNLSVGSLNNFWRSCENMTVLPTYEKMTWAVSQAASLRSMDIKGDLTLFALGNNPDTSVGAGFASGGFIANTKANNVKSGAQQQFICRNSTFNSFQNPLWNQVLVGCDLATPALECCLKEGSQKTLLIEKATPRISEKPYLVQTDPANKYVLSIIKPPRNSSSSSYSGHLSTPITSSIEVTRNNYFIATPGTTSDIINNYLTNGKDIIFCPGIYYLDKTIILKGQLLFGLGVPRIISKNANDIVKGHGDICGIIFEAAETPTGIVNNKTILVNMNDNKPSNLWDVYCRVGGGTDENKSYSADKMLYVAGDNSILDNCWCWVADHYASNKYTGWSKAVCNIGVHIAGDSVICYGMFSEHNHGDNLYWTGDNGQMYMFQSEFNYFPENPDSFKNSVSYNVDKDVKNHKIRGAGAYCFFACSQSESSDIYALAGFRFPKNVIVDYKTVFTVYLNGYGGIKNVIVDENDNGDGYVVEWVGQGEEVTNTKCSPSFTRQLGTTMLKYRCDSDSNLDFCECDNCLSPSTCIDGQCKPQFGCSSKQKSEINSGCTGKCDCGPQDNWKCTTNPEGCFSSQKQAYGVCTGDKYENVCKWW
jgi:hypothetical protein